MSERLFEQDGKLIIHRQEDLEPVIESARMMKDAPSSPVSDSWHVARIPRFLVAIWLQEAGVSWDDPASRDVIERNLMDPTYSKFRVKEGSFR